MNENTELCGDCGGTGFVETDINALSECSNCQGRGITRKESSAAMTENEEAVLQDANDKRAVDEWIADIISTLKSLAGEGNLLLDGDGGPDYMAGIEDETQRERVRQVQAALLQMTTTLSCDEETIGVFL